MTHRHFLRPLAEQDVAEIWTDGAQRWDLDQADAYFDGMMSLFDLLSEQPEIARLRHEFKPPIRLHIYRSHIVIFETVETGIAIIRVLHQRRNILALLEE
ncbi:type II toxin-antitoxin system RelE/ParE family toxin [Falsihalocynthiibacter sp. S25ZX9]|uniref:type II toxin-antitoxin system RelE/ParE family toxin n=1 Tax=Falsihalocynthiibacter sp. S25ZX9 TaxID=3240870 RepID=UPI00350F9D67